MENETMTLGVKLNGSKVETVERVEKKRLNLEPVKRFLSEEITNLDMAMAINSVICLNSELMLRSLSDSDLRSDISAVVNIELHNQSYFLSVFAEELLKMKDTNDLAGIETYFFDWGPALELCLAVTNFLGTTNRMIALFAVDDDRFDRLAELASVESIESLKEVKKLPRLFMEVHRIIS